MCDGEPRLQHASHGFSRLLGHTQDSALGTWSVCCLLMHLRCESSLRSEFWGGGGRFHDLKSRPGEGSWGPGTRSPGQTSPQQHSVKGQETGSPGEPQPKAPRTVSRPGRSEPSLPLGAVGSRGRGARYQDQTFLLPSMAPASSHGSSTFTTTGELGSCPWGLLP